MMLQRMMRFRLQGQQDDTFCKHVLGCVADGLLYIESALWKQSRCTLQGLGIFQNSYR